MTITSETKLDSAQAFTIASSWGSYITAGDPGAVFYTFPAGDAQVQSEDHRAQLIAYTDACLISARAGEVDGPDDTETHVAELEALRRYFETAHAQDEFVWWTSSDGSINLQMTREQAASVSHSGRCDDDVEALRRVPAIAAQLEKIDPSDAREELEGYGAWDEEELADHSANLDRIVWQAGCAIAEGQCDPEETDQEGANHTHIPHNPDVLQTVCTICDVELVYDSATDEFSPVESDE